MSSLFFDDPESTKKIRDIRNERKRLKRLPFFATN